MYEEDDEEWFEEPWEEEEEDAYWSDDGYEEMPEEVEEAADQMDEAYISYLESRRRMRDLALSRGFYLLVAIGPEVYGKSRGRGDGKGKGKSKGKGKGNEGKGKGGSENPFQGSSCVWIAEKPWQFKLWNSINHWE